MAEVSSIKQGFVKVGSSEVSLSKVCHTAVYIGKIDVG
jgi:hypothetical protein